MTEMLTELSILQEDTMKNRYLTFKLGKEIYGMGVGNVIEIIGIQTITEMPCLEKYIMGIINLRGKIIPIMDVRLRFDKEKKQYDDRTCIIVININDVLIGLIVDSVCEVLTINEDEIVEPPHVDMARNGFIKNIGKVNNDVLLLLDCDKLYSGNLTLITHEI